MKTRFIGRQSIAAFTLAAPLAALAAPPAEILLGNGNVAIPGPYARQALETDVDSSAVAAGRGAIVLQLPGGGSVVLNRTGFEQRGEGNAMWRGQSAQHSDSEAVITAHNGLMVGRIVLDDKVYTLQPGANGHHLFQELDTAAFPECDSGAGQLVALDSEAPGGAVSASAEAAGTVIDLLSVYTQRVSSRLGSQAAAEAMIQSAVDNANAAFSNSNVDVQYRLVHTAQVDYSTAGTTTDDLYWVTGDPGIASLRDEVGADMVSIIVDTAGSCGTGWVQRSPSAGFQAYAFQATDMDCAVGNLTFAHEHGHNMGMEHNPENSSVGTTPENASYDFSFAHYVDGAYRTVMSYSSPCSRGCSRVARHSNPELIYSGSPTGVTGVRDNAQTGRLTAPVVSDFRSPAEPVLPGFSVRITAGADDVTQNNADGLMNPAGATLPIGEGATVGLRFNGVNVPQGAVITRAYIELSAGASAVLPASVSLQSVAADNAAPFTTDAYSLSDLPVDASALWPVGGWAVGDVQTSVDLSSQVQALVDRAGWVQGNAMTFVLTGSGLVPATAYEGGASLAPVLHVEFETDQSPANIPPVAGFSAAAADLQVNFTDASSDPDGSLVSWSWVFGDGAGSSSRNPQHTYIAAGTYTVALEVLDDQGAMDSFSSAVTVSLPPPPEPAVPKAPSALSKAVAQEGKGKRKTITSVTLSWTHDAENTNYLVLEGCLETISGKGKNRQVFCDWSEMVSSIPGDASSVDAPVAEEDYRYRIRAVNSVGSSAWSNEVKI